MASFGGWGGDEAVAAAADQVGAASLQKRFADLEVVLGLEVLQERPLELAVAQVASHVDFLAGEGVQACVVRARRDCQGRSVQSASYLMCLPVLSRGAAEGPAERLVEPAERAESRAIRDRQD